MGEEQEENNRGRMAGREWRQGVGGRGQAMMSIGHMANGLINKNNAMGPVHNCHSKKNYYCWMLIGGLEGTGRPEGESNNQSQRSMQILY